MAKRTTSSKTTRRRELPEIPPVFARVSDAFNRRRDVTLEAGWRADGAVLKTKGKIFVMLHEGNLVAKLPKERVDALVAQKHGSRFDPRRDGRVMKEWAVVGPGSIDWATLAEEAYEFARQAKGSAGRRPRGR